MATRKHIFSELEKKAFLDILKRYSSVIENKNTDGVSLRCKNEAWKNVSREYNASPYSTAPVTDKQLRRLWMNLKQRQRDALTKERQHRLATGGGPSTDDAVVDPDVSQVAPALIVGIDDALDSDTFAETADSWNTVTEDTVMDSQAIPSAHTQIIDSQSILSLPSTSHNSTFCIMPLTPPATVTPACPPSRSIIIRPPHAPSPPIPPLRITTPLPPAPAPPPPSIPASCSNTQPFQRYKQSILEQEYKDRQRRANEMHELELVLIEEKIKEAKEKTREAKAKADLAEFELQQQIPGNFTTLLN